MFTGIVARTVRVRSWSGGGRARRLVIEARAQAASAGDVRPWSDLEAGESIAVNGVCLTLVEGGARATGQLAFDVVPETLRRSALGDLVPGSLVNLERSLRVGDRLGGHYVLGHVDAIGRIVHASEEQGEGNERRLTIQVEQDGRTWGEPPFQVLAKGSVTIDGVSLTVVDPRADSFAVALVPHTLEVTNLGRRRAGERVNLEMDHFGKWVRALLTTPARRVPAPDSDRPGARAGEEDTPR